MNSVSGSSDLNRLMGEYESFNVLHWWYKGLFRGLGGPKIDQNCQICEFWSYFFCIVTS